jgi:hypothetical protein
VCSQSFALQRLNRAKIAVFCCKKQGAYFTFCTKDKDVEKVFAIFKNPCYNVTIVKHSKKFYYFSKLKQRAGITCGTILFCALVALSNAFVLKISITGSGSYLSDEIRGILYSEGVREYAPYKTFDSSIVCGKILALPNVTFCNIKKRGSVLCVDIEVEKESASYAKKTSLVSDVDGKVCSIVVLCGTACVDVGDEVLCGSKLIDGSGGLAVGYAKVEYSGVCEYFADCESEENLKNAYAVLLLEDGEIVSRTYSVEKAEKGVKYTLYYTAIKKLCINMG